MFVHAVLIRDVADDGFDGATTLHEFFEIVCDAALVALGGDAQIVGVWRIVTALASIGEINFCISGITFLSVCSS